MRSTIMLALGATLLAGAALQLSDSARGQETGFIWIEGGKNKELGGPDTKGGQRGIIIIGGKNKGGQRGFIPDTGGDPKQIGDPNIKTGVPAWASRAFGNTGGGGGGGGGGR